MASRSWIAGLGIALGAWTTGCERHSWDSVSEMHRGHHDSHDSGHSAEAHGAATEGSHGKPADESHGKAEGTEAGHAGEPAASPGAAPKD